MARRVRIAVSVFFGALTVALCVLWVRSYWQCESIARNNGIFTEIAIGNGGASYFRSAGMGSLIPIMGWAHHTQKNRQYEPRFACQNDSGDLQLESPLWFLTLGTAIVSAAFGWSARPLPLHFSLRALLIATAATAILMGLLVSMLR